MASWARNEKTVHPDLNTAGAAASFRAAAVRVQKAGISRKLTRWLA